MKRNLAAASGSLAAASARLPSSFWLLKSEPSDYGIAHMQEEKRTMWDGVRK